MKKVFNQLVVLLLFTISSLSFAQAQGYQVGDIATDFTLKNIDGKMVSLADYPDAKGYVVIFTCNHCPFAKAYEDRIVALQNEFGPKGFQVIAINPNDPEKNPDDSFDNMIVRAKEKGFNFPYLFDDGQKIYPIYGATKTPHVYLLDNDRTVKYIGSIDDSPRDETAVEVTYLADAMNAMVEGTEINPSFTKAIGCGIK